MKASAISISLIGLGCISGCVRPSASETAEPVQATPAAAPAPPPAAATAAPAAPAQAQQQPAAQAAPAPAAPRPEQHGELLATTDFSKGPGIWGNNSNIEVVKEGNSSFLRYTAENPGPNHWSLTFGHPDVILVDGRMYQLKFEARSGDPQSSGRSLAVGIRNQGGDWYPTGLDRKINLTNEWQSFEFTFPGKKNTTDLSILRFDLENVPGIIDLRNPSLKPVE